MPAKDAESKPGRIAQVRAAFTMTRAQDPRLVPAVFGPALAVLVVLVLLGVFLGQYYLIGLGILGAIAVAVTVFGRRAQRAMYAQVEGQTGAAYAVLQTMRGDWRVTPAVQVTRAQDMVHRVLGRPGVVLVGEGSAARLAQLLANEKRRIGRVAPETPVYEFRVGDDADAVPLNRLAARLMRLPRNLKPGEVGDIEARLTALRDAGPPIPKGPMPRSPRLPRGRMR